MPRTHRLLPATGAVALCGLLLGAAQPAASYEFDHVEVSYAAAFQVELANGSALDWAVQLAAPGQVLNVTLGQVKLTRTDNTTFGEGLVRLQGPNGTVRMLVNSAHFDRDANATHPRVAAWLFWSAKRIEDKAIVKDFTPPVSTVIVIQTLEDGVATAMRVWTSQDPGAGQGLWWQDPVGVPWTARMETLREAGEVGP